MGQKTVHEALIAELLGDVGKLHDSIKALPGDLKAKVGPSMESIEKLAKDATDALEAAKETQKADIKRFSDAEKASIASVIQDAMRNDLGGNLSQVAKSLEESARAHERAVKAKSRSDYLMIFAVCVAALLGSTVGLAMGHYMYGQNIKEEAEIGRAVLKVLPKLDNETQYLIEREIDK